MSKYRAICYYSGSCEGVGDTEEEAIADAENNVPLDATPDSYETFYEYGGEVEEDDEE